jgi:hypothetical protein
MSEWRKRYKVHPSADVFPMMSDDELALLKKVRGAITKEMGMTAHPD